MVNVLIISLRPLSPVRSGFQNTVSLLNNALKKKFNVKFVFSDNSNDIDPVFDLNYDPSFDRNLNRLIQDLNPEYIFINTSKLLYLYRDTLFKDNNKVILVCHDLYYFRKDYFKKNNLSDSTSITKNEELDVLKKCKYIIDFAHYEYEFLNKNRINKSKLFFTMSPVEIFEFNYSDKRVYDFFFIGSKWQQNTLSLNHFFKQSFEYFKNKKIKVVGTNFIDQNLNFSYSSSLDQSDFFNSKIGLAPIYEGTGRNVKIFDMMANSLPVITNKDLSVYGLESGYHYILVNNFNDWKDELRKLEKSYDNRKFIAFNGWKWVNENSNANRVFTSLLENLDEEIKRK